MTMRKQPHERKRPARPGEGRPKIPIPEEKVLTLARYGVTNVDIAAFFECDEGVIRKRFATKIARARAERKVKLFERQWAKAMDGDSTMLIWLGKQEGQTDRSELTGKDGAPLFARIERVIVKPTA